MTLSLGEDGRQKHSSVAGRARCLHRNDLGPMWRLEDSATLSEQENPSVSGYWPRRQSPVVNHKALIPVRGSQPPWKNYQNKFVRSTGDRTRGLTGDT